MLRNKPGRLNSRHNISHHIPVHVGQAEVAALETIGQALEAQQMQDGGGPSHFVHLFG